MIFDKPSVIRMTTPDEGALAQMLMAVSNAGGAAYGGYLDEKERQRQAMLDQARMDEEKARMDAWKEQQRMKQIELQRQTEDELLKLQEATSKYAPETEDESAARALDTKLIGDRAEKPAAWQKSEGWAPDPVKAAQEVEANRNRTKPLIEEVTLPSGEKAKIPARFREDVEAQSAKALRDKRISEGGIVLTEAAISGLPEPWKSTWQPGQVVSAADYDRAVDNGRRGSSSGKKYEHLSQSLPGGGSRIGVFDPVEGTVKWISGGGGSQADASSVFPGKTGNDLLNVLSQQDRANVQALLEYRADPRGLSSLRNERRAYLMGLASRIDPTFSMGEYPSRWKAEQDFRSGKESQNIKSLNTVTAHLEKLAKAAEGLNNRRFPWWNRKANAFLSSIGDPRLKRFTTDAKGVAGEAATLFKGTSGTDQEIKKWYEEFDTSQSPEQLKASISELAGLIRGRRDAIVDKYKGAVGRDVPPGFEAKTDRILDRLESLGGDSSDFSPSSDFDSLIDDSKIHRGSSSRPRSAPGTSSPDAVRQFLYGLDTQPSHTGRADKSLVNKYK